MSSVIVVDKKSLDQSTVSGSRIVLETASKVYTQLYRSDVAEFVQDGNDLILKLKNGKTIVIVNFFVAHEDETSDVLFKDDNGIPWLPLLLGGAGIAGGLALASGGGGGDNNNGGVASVPKNHVPVPGLSNQPIEALEDQPKKGQITDVTDKDGDELTYKVGDKPTHGTVTVDEKTGEYTYRPNPDYHGDDKFTVVVSDGKGGEVTVTVPVTVTSVNDDPTAKPEQGFTTDEDTEHKGQIVAKDKDGDELTYKVGEEPNNGKVVIDEKTGEYMYKPNPDYHGDDKFTVVVSDGNGGEVTVTVPVTVTPVNDDPTAEAEQGFTTDEDIEHQGKIIAEDKDKGDKLTYKVGEAPKNGTVTVDEKTGEYTYKPNPDYHGDDKFTVVVSDGKGGEVTVTVPVTVTSVNDDPTAKPEQDFTTDEDTEHKGQIVAKDKDGDELTYKVGDKPTHGTVTVDEKTGEYTYTPNPDYHGDDKFTVVVSDGKGGKLTVTVPVTVTPVNDAPETTKSEQPIEALEDQPKKGQITDVTDKDGDELTYKVGDKPTHGTVTVDEKTGEYTYTPNPDYHGDDKFTVVVSDGNGGEVTVTVPVTVTPVNDAPTAEAEQGFTTDEDTEHQGKIIAEDKDKGDELSYKVGEEPNNGKVVIDEKTGAYTYTPNPDYHGDDKFTVVVTDGNGGEVTVIVPVAVNPVNDAPNIEDAEVTVKQGVKDSIVHDVNDASTGKDEDVDGDKLTYTITKGNEDGLFVIDPNTGIITLADGKMLDHGKAPQHQLEVTATDSSEEKLSSTATITINVSNDSKITTEITPKGTITGTTDNVEKGPGKVKLTITGTDKDGQPVTIERDVELDRPDGSSEGKYTYQLTPEDGIVDGSKVTVEAQTVDRQGDTIHADTELPGHSSEETPGLDLVIPTIEITQVATDEKVTWGEEGKEGFEVKGTTTGVEAGQIVAVTFDKTVDGQPVTVEATVGKDGSWTAQMTPEQAAKLLEGSVSAAVKDIAGNEKSAEAVEYTIDTPTAVVTGYSDNIENVLNTVVTEGKVSETVTISSEIDPNLASDTTKTMVGETIPGDHGTFTLDASGKWTYTLNSGEATSKALIDSKGPLTEIFTVKDSEGKSYEVKVSINDRVADDGEHVFISATSSLLKDPTNVESDQGAYTIYTNDSLGEITGTASQGVEKVRVYVNKQAADTDAAMDSLGYPQYFEVAVKDGKWSLSEQDLTDGLQKTWWADQLNNDKIYLQVRAIDPTTGKVGEVSEKYTFVVDTVAPEATYVNYEDGKVTALVSGDPNDKHHAKKGNEVIVKYTDKDGNVQVVTGKVGDKTVADKPYLSISVDVKDPSKVDSVTDFKVYVKDSAGNIGVNNDSKENPLKIELPTPQVDQYHDNVNNVSGTEIIGNTGYSDDPSGLISGTIVLTEADLKVVDSVRIYLYDNRQKWIEIDKKDLVKESDNTYRWTTKPGDLSEITTTGKLAEGEVKFYAATYDKESGSLSELSPPFKVTIDVTAPEITIESIAEDGIVSQSEKEKGFSIKGSATGVEEGNTVTVDFNGKTYESKVTNVVDGKGMWEITVPSEDSKSLIDEIEKNAIARVTDKAGNTSDPAEKVVRVYSKILAKTDLITIDEDHGVMKGEIKGTESWVKYKLLTSIPSEIGTLEFIGDEYSGHFNFTPAKDWSGKVEFDVLVEDYYGDNRTIVTQVIDIIPIADKPVLKTEMDFDIGELSLNKYTWNNIRGYQYIGGKWYNFDDAKVHGAGINSDVLINGINALLAYNVPTSYELTNDMKSAGWTEYDPGYGLAESSAVYMNGYVYLEAGKSYKYTGSADDTGMIIIGDYESSKYVSWQGIPSLSTETFTVKESGFYTFNLYIYNQHGQGNYNFRVTEEDGTDVKYFPSIDAIKSELGKDVHLAEKMTGKDGKGFYGVSFGYTGSENDDVELTGIVASLADRDGSETLSLKLTGLVEGTKLIYTSVDKDGKEVTSEAVADSHGSITVNGGVNVTDFKDLSLDLPQGIATGKLPVAMTVTATEQGNGDAKSVTKEFTVTVNPPVAARMMVTDESEEDHTSDTHVIKIGLLEDNNTGGHSLEKVINFAINQSEEFSESSKIEFSEDFFNGLISKDLTADNLVNVEKFINVTYDQDAQTATMSVDRDGLGDQYQFSDLLLLTNQSTEISLEDLLNNHQISII
ncbi:hypothetical protein B9T13_09865 [Wohlfahrtiimonas chitiniclastica]|uniref:tandem-95 repeat protein n=1 Tax=Wohlfahrtiimonas chitiniclastica TaxID=400946 RepID=UPI000B99CA99|nr:tandem-95 repeat protein [Wohlfahrtiimonas chitiniclastica]OYQ69097.1 hypothetical protein B9T13_09865 [Wohlfahrtiimonas chitiniclastica]